MSVCELIVFSPSNVMKKSFLPHSWLRCSLTSSCVSLLLMSHLLTIDHGDGKSNKMLLLSRLNINSFYVSRQTSERANERTNERTRVNESSVWLRNETSTEMSSKEVSSFSFRSDCVALCKGCLPVSLSFSTAIPVCVYSATTCVCVQTWISFSPSSPLLSFSLFNKTRDE